MRVNVKQEHIEAGKHGFSQCPIALAVKDRLGCDSVQVTNQYVEVARYNRAHSDAEYDSIQCQLYGLSSRAKEFVKNFDAKKPVKPFSFNMNNAYYRPY